MLRRAFTILELAITLILVGLGAGLYMHYNETKDPQECYTQTKDQLSRIEAEMRRYIIANDRLPRPALRTTGVEDPMFGREAASFGDLDSASGVAYGALPFQAIGLSQEFASDCWGNKLTYVVTANLTDAVVFKSNSDGVIDVKGPGGTSVNQKVAWAVVSHGENALGAVKSNFRDTTNINRGWCSYTLGGSTPQEGENCDPSNNVLVAGVFNNGKDAGVNYYDDMLVYAGKSAIEINGRCDLSGINRCLAGNLTSPATPGGCGGADVWQCAGLNGGSPENCSLPQPPCPVNGQCGITTNTCVAGSFANPVPGTCGSTADTWDCMGSYGGSNANCTASAITPCPIPGQCDNTVTNGCLAGTATGFAAGACGTADTWTCTGAGGNDACSKANAPCAVPENGSCGATANSCVTGTPTNTIAGACGTTDTWDCAGTNGGTNASCSVANAACGTCSPAVMAAMEVACPQSFWYDNYSSIQQVITNCSECGNNAVATCEYHYAHSEYGTYSLNEDTFKQINYDSISGTAYITNNFCSYKVASSGYPGGGYNYTEGVCPFTSDSCPASVGRPPQGASLDCSASSQTWGAGCSATNGALANGGSVSLNNSTPGYTGSVTLACSNGTLTQSGASCTSTGPSCGATDDWGVCTGGSCNTCCNGVSSSCANNNGGDIVLTQGYGCNGAVCPLPSVGNCPSQSVTWAGANISCGAILPLTGSGNSVAATDTGYGSATYTCNAGSWVGPTSATCGCTTIENPGTVCNAGWVSIIEKKKNSPGVCRIRCHK